MTTIDDTISSIQQLQNDLAQITQFLQTYQSGQINGMNIDKISLKIIITNLIIKITTDLQSAQTNFQMAIQTL